MLRASCPLLSVWGSSMRHDLSRIIDTHKCTTVQWPELSIWITLFDTAIGGRLHSKRAGHASEHRNCLKTIVLCRTQFRVILMVRPKAALQCPPGENLRSSRVYLHRSVATIMPKKRTSSSAALPQQYFVRELAGENPPSLPAMKRLYELASSLYGLRPWRLLDESQLILVRDSTSGELCYCSIMGALGEVFSLHAYIGTESLRLFRKMEIEEIADAGEFFATQHSVSVEFVPRAEIERQDRELLAMLGHPQSRGLVWPIFRTIRPGFQPWFVTEEEARTLAECIGAVIVVCSAVASQESVKFWDLADTYPMVSRTEGAEPRYRVDLVKSILPAEPPIPPVRLEEEALRPSRQSRPCRTGSDGARPHTQRRRNRQEE